MTKEERAEKLKEDRETRAKYKRPRDWKECGYAYVIHFMQGVIAGIIMMMSISASNLILTMLSFSMIVLFIAYQGRKHAHAVFFGCDIEDFSVGYGIGIAIIRKGTLFFWLLQQIFKRGYSISEDIMSGIYRLVLQRIYIVGPLVLKRLFFWLLQQILKMVNSISEDIYHERNVPTGTPIKC